MNSPANSSETISTRRLALAGDDIRAPNLLTGVGRFFVESVTDQVDQRTSREKRCPTLPSRCRTISGNYRTARHALSFFSSADHQTTERKAMTGVGSPALPMSWDEGVDLWVRYGFHLTR